MRILGILTLSVMMGACGITRQEVTARLGEHYIGHSVDALVVDFGPPGNTFKMNSGDTSYVWVLGNLTNIRTDDSGSGAASTEYCKVSVIADKAGIVTQLNTEDSQVDFATICSQRLGIRRRT